MRAVLIAASCITALGCDAVSGLDDFVIVGSGGGGMASNGGGGTSSTGGSGGEGGSPATGGGGEGGAPPLDGYAGTIVADGPLAYWRLGDAADTLVATAFVGAYDGNLEGAVTLGQPGLITGDPDTAAYVTGSGQNRIVIPNSGDLAFYERRAGRPLLGWATRRGRGLRLRAHRAADQRSPSSGPLKMRAPQRLTKRPSW